MSGRLPLAVASMGQRWLAGDEESEFGVHIEYEDLYDSIIFLTAIYMAGQIASLGLKMPNLVGEIVVGILLGPPLADYVPNAEAWVLLGEIGLVLLVLEAGIDIDVSTLKLIGTRGFLIAIIGSILPIALGIIIAIVINGTSDMKANIAAGASFGPTSLGIALNILRSGGILNTPVGQLIVSAAVIDDMIALIVLSQLESLTGEITAGGILIPIVSALAFLCIGGYIALFVLPGLINKYFLPRFPVAVHPKVEMYLMFGIMLAMMPATFYAKASYLMGAFVSGLAFCTSHDLHHLFVVQFKRLLQWLMRIFFAASIGFQVPIKDLVKGDVLWKGLVFTLALLGKLAVGFLVPNFTQSPSFTGIHLRDCLMTGFSMAAEGEFAFVIAVYAVDNGLIDKDLYASVVLAVLLSTIFPPFLLRFTISYYNKKAEANIQKLANEEMERQHDLEYDENDSIRNPGDLANEIEKGRAVFLCIQTQSMSQWGLLHHLMSTVAKLKLDIIDHRSWHPRGINSTLVNEIYARDRLLVKQKGMSQQALEERILDITQAIEKAIAQPDTSKVKVQRWFPGVVEEITESVHGSKKTRGTRNLTVEQRLLTEASQLLDKKQTAQMTVTKEKTVEEILAEMQDKVTESTQNLGEALSEAEKNAQANAATTGATDAALANASPALPPSTARRRSTRRRKMRSTPVVGGGLFGETSTSSHHDEPGPTIPSGAAVNGTKPKKSEWKPDFDMGRTGHRAEIFVDGEAYDVRLSDETLRSLQRGFSGDMVDNRGISLSGVRIQPSGSRVVGGLQGYVRNPGTTLTKIMESTDDGESETSSAHRGEEQPPV